MVSSWWVYYDLFGSERVTISYAVYETDRAGCTARDEFCLAYLATEKCGDARRACDGAITNGVFELWPKGGDCQREGRSVWMGCCCLSHHVAPLMIGRTRAHSEGNLLLSGVTLVI